MNCTPVYSGYPDLFSKHSEKPRRCSQKELNKCLSRHARAASVANECSSLAYVTRITGKPTADVAARHSVDTTRSTASSSALQSWPVTPYVHAEKPPQWPTTTPLTAATW